ncbi:MAG: hypothetical protein WC526_00380 [Patescibacteria group bacterium]
MKEANKDKARERMKLVNLKTKERRQKLYSEMREEAIRLYDIYSKESLFLEGLMLYWGEGDNKLENGKIRVTNSNPLLIKNFHIFLKHYLPQISAKAKVYLVLYPDLKESGCKDCWSKIVELPLDKFFKSQYIKGHSVKRTLPFGVGTIIISSRSYKEMVMQWLELRKKEISLARV